MILVDSSVWIDFFHGKTTATSLGLLVETEKVLLHPWILGELMVGHLGKPRQNRLNDLGLLPKAAIHSIEVLKDFVEQEKLFGLGFSLVDIQLVYSSLLEDAFIWTFDRKLDLLAKHYKKAYSAL
ncbi:MAG: VapC toxin family PIN domain ribonuclease [Deltaproteobacteria bacterium]|nr:VapC toxin family PIN domain ribonuclease [Deltaproteobacteria bacterium]